MKRLWIGISVLALLLVCGSVVTVFMERSHRPISKNLVQAADAALAGNWSHATALVNRAQAKWQRCKPLTATFADHSILEETDSLLAEIKLYANARETLSFTAACIRLSQLTEAISKSHRPSWQNFL